MDHQFSKECAHDHTIGGAVARVANAFGHRDAMFNLGIFAISDDPAMDAEQKAWARKSWQKILPYTIGAPT